MGPKCSLDPQNWLIGFCWKIVANQKEKKPATCHPLLHFDAGAAHQEVLLSASVAVPKGHCALRHKFTMTAVSGSEFLGNIENMFFRFCILIFLMKTQCQDQSTNLPQDGVISVELGYMGIVVLCRDSSSSRIQPRRPKNTLDPVGEYQRYCT